MENTKTKFNKTKEILKAIACIDMINNLLIEYIDPAKDFIEFDHLDTMIGSTECLLDLFREVQRHTKKPKVDRSSYQ